ncbi:4400_t:CDS:2 [Entrophospora sp. SA101]|nr:4400_t:CDS:2 [Entrophospora sp. SA101]
MPIVPVSSDIPTVENQNFQENINHAPTEAESPEIAENFEPELEAENNGAFYHWGFKAFPQSQISESKKWKILDWMLTKMSANPRKKSTIDSILRWNYYGGVGEPFYKDFFHKEKTWEQFIESAVWKPNKNNIRVQKFIKRMRKEYEKKIPDPGERFKNSENFEPGIEEENNGAFYHRGFKAFPQSQISENEKGETIDMTDLQIEHIKAFPIRGYYVEKKPYLRHSSETSDTGDTGDTY